MNRLRDMLDFVEGFDNFLSEDSWKGYFDIQCKAYLDQQPDNNLKVFLGF